MGVYIKGMEKPQGCRDCELLHKWDDERYRCPFISYLQWVEYDDIEDYIVSDACPLIEVKTPHGNLIDRDRAIDGAKVDGAWAALAYEPTVIEAEALKE